MSDKLTPQDYRRQTKLLLLRTQGPLCPLCLSRPVSDLHEIVFVKGIQKCSKYHLEGDYAMAVYAPGNCILLCNRCNISVANSLSIDRMLALKMSTPDVKPEYVVEAARKVASFSKIPRHWLPATVTCNGITYPIISQGDL